MSFNDVCSKSRIREVLMAITVWLCLFSMADAKPRAFKTRPKPSKLALGVGLETGAASYNAEEEIQPTIALRASLSLLNTVRRELGRGLPTRWFGLYGRLQNDFDDDHLRTAAGVTAGFLFLHGDLGWTKYTVEDSEFSGPELLLGLGIFDVFGLYTRWTWLSNDQSISELGLRVNVPIWVSKPRSRKRGQ